MTEQWKINAAERFNDKIRMTPQPESDWPGTPMPPKEPVTVVDHVEAVYEAQARLFHAWVDTVTLGRVA